MLSRTAYVNLLSAMSAAPSSLAGAAHALLARAIVRRLSVSGLEYRSASSPQPHFAFADYDASGNAQQATTLAGLLDGSNALNGGALRARYYYHYDRKEGLSNWCGGVQATPGTQPSGSTYTNDIAVIESLAAQLTSTVMAQLSAEQWAAANAPWLDLFQREDWYLQSDLALIGIASEGSAVGAALRVERRGKWGGADLADDTTIVLPTAGQWRYWISGALRTSSNASPGSISIALCEGAIQRAVVSASRPGTDPSVYAVLAEHGAFLPGEAPAVTFSGTQVQVRNVSAAGEVAAALVLRLWQE